MREIKFRAYDTHTKTMLPVVDIIKFTKIEDVNILRTGAYGVSVCVPFQPSIKLMQYTGLKDKNGKEIYEGDIVAEKGHYVKSDRLVYQKIQWKENYSCWLRGEYQRLTPKNIKTYQIEVIGNIYDNPDLLKE